MNSTILAEEIISHKLFTERSNEYIRWYPKHLTPFNRNLKFSFEVIDGIYIHVPFCDKICKFCPFVKSLSKEADIDHYTNYLKKEISIISRYVKDSNLKFIYFGGGTPSSIGTRRLEQILDTILSHFHYSDDLEISIEVHPTHSKNSIMRTFKEIGFNRVSIGIQSFQSKLLNKLGATHSEIESFSAVESALSIFDNVAVDLIYGINGETLENWEHDLYTAVKTFNIPHLSCYPLIPIRENEANFNSAVEINFGTYALEYLKLNSLNHYASCASGGFDVAKSGFECKYELMHWQAPQAHFLGLGPAAFGFTGNFSTVNISNLNSYFKAIDAETLPLASLVEISIDELMHRFFVLGVKTLKVDLDAFYRKFKINPEILFKNQITTLINNKLIIIDNQYLELTAVGKMYIDFCSTMFFSEGQRNVNHPEENEIRMIEKMLISK